MRLLKSAFKAWSTWVSAALTAITTGYVTYMPELRDTLSPETYVKVMIGAVGLITFLRFIDQGLSDD